MFGDPLLSSLEKQAEISNQTVALAAATYRGAQALVGEARSQMLPAVTASPSVNTTSTSYARTTTYQLPFAASWEADLWGRIRNTVNASADEAQATAGDLQNTRLLLQAEFAAEYFQLREQDCHNHRLDRTAA